MITWPGESLLESCRNNCAILTPSWLLKEYCDLVAYPITEILNASYAEPVSYTHLTLPTSDLV